RQLQYFWPQAVGGTPPQLLSGKAQYLAEAASRLRFTTDRAILRDLAAIIEWSKVSMLTPDTPEENLGDRELPTGFTPQGLARVARAYEDLKTERNAIDFEDVLLATVAILEEDDAVAAAFEPEQTVAVDDFSALIEHLSQVHPSRYRQMIDGLDGIAWRGVQT
ncbi:ATP-dependent DNA helicase, partial [Staphylococcus sp. EG-SA-29]|nr:ATP-dependent DNA helicase [Staphylococcus sp. EG-SA-29]